MNIYFINKHSKLKGPFDIVDSNNKYVLRIGDVCVRETNNDISFLFVVSTVNKWKACKCLEQIISNIEIEGNSLLFCFDGLSKRQGNVTLLNLLSNKFTKPLLRDFFCNAIDILTYKKDMWNISIIANIYSITPVTTTVPIVVDNKSQKESNYCLFESYLIGGAHDLFITLFSQHLGMRDIFKQIKKEYPQEFRQSLKKFLTDNPNSTIYDMK